MKDEEVKQNSVYAAIDVKRRNKENEGNFNIAEQAFAADFHKMASEAFQGSTVYPPNYRKNIITVKVDHPGSDLIRLEVKKFEKFAIANNVKIKDTRYGNHIYTLPRIENK